MPKEKVKAIKHAGPLESQLSGEMDAGGTAKKSAARREKRVEGKRGLGSKAAMAMHDDEDLPADAEIDAETGGDEFLSSKMSRRVLDEARVQRVEADVDPAGKDYVKKKGGVRFNTSSAAGAPAAGARHGVGAIAKSVASAGKGHDRSAAGDDDASDDDADAIVDFDAHDDVALEGDYVDARLEGLDPAALAGEEAIMRRFMPDGAGARRTLADIIMDKIREKEAGGTGGGGAAGAGSADNEEDGEGDVAGGGGGAELDPKVVEVYTEVGRYLARYKSGKLPKVFKVIPGLSNWEEVLFLTNPETWTPHSTYAATRIFASNFNAAKAQRFFALILLPKCRDDIYFHKRLNFHLYLALKKATYKPAGFFKGIILPLAAAGDCTLREALIFGSVMAKMSLPQLHSAAALMKLASIPYNGAVSVLLKILINKKYTLPFMAVDALAAHFAAFIDEEGPLPLLWHQALLALSQRYKADLTAAQKGAIKALLHVHAHHAITPEVRRELFSAGCRGDAPSVLGAGGAVVVAAAAPAVAVAGAAGADAAAAAASAASAAAAAASAFAAGLAGPAAVLLAGAAAATGAKYGVAGPAKAPSGGRRPSSAAGKHKRGGGAGASGDMDVDF